MTTTADAATPGDLPVATTIIDQINHADKLARARWGIVRMMGDATSVTLHMSGGPLRTLRAKIIYGADDLYTVELWRIDMNPKTFACVKLREQAGVYNDALVRTIDFLLAEQFKADKLARGKGKRKASVRHD